MNPQIIQVLSGVSSLLGLLAILAYFYSVSQERRAERSVREIVEGEPLFNAKQVIQILKLFQDDERRLEALREFAAHERGKADQLLRKIKKNVDLGKLQSDAARTRLLAMIIGGAVLLLFGVIGFVWAHRSEQGEVPVAVSDPVEVLGPPPTVEAEGKKATQTSEAAKETPEPLPTVFVGREIDYDAIPAEIRAPLSFGMNDTELRNELYRRRSLTLDGATLRLDRSGRQEHTLAGYSLELKNGARIITGGGNLALTFVRVIAEKGAIRSFSDDLLVPPPAQEQNSGTPGKDGGRVLLASLERPTGQLIVDLRGQSGGKGGIGPRGAPGPAGRPGDNASQTLFGCSHGAGNGHPGGQGGRGLQGLPGGSGGRGGVLILSSAYSAASELIEFTAKGGTGGQGGPGGLGGPGGQGGPGGREEGPYCRGNGFPGPPGPEGERGDDGPSGTDGHDGHSGAYEDLQTAAAAFSENPK